MAWILSLWANPMARKIITYAAVIAAICLCLRWWGNAQWAKGEVAGRLYEAKAIEQSKQAEWKAKEAAIAAAAKTVAEKKASVAAAGERLNQDRINLSRSLKDGLAVLQQERNRQYANVATVPDDRLWDAIRSVSRELAAPNP